VNLAGKILYLYNGTPGFSHENKKWNKDFYAKRTCGNYLGKALKFFNNDVKNFGLLF